ncbi:MAG: hypothetical protein J7K61_04105 [Thermoplasmata archaeon]|nr:hypothetical protein [Thermoplasmata archaeon]
MKKLALALIITFLLMFPINSAVEGGDGDGKIVVKIALYDSMSPSVRLLEKCFHYAWYENGTRYEMDVRRVDYQDIMNGSLSSYSAMVIGASGRQYFESFFDDRWKDRVKEFISNGGGYVGICGGANIATKGYEKPRHWLDFVLNRAALGLIDAYINDDQWEEWQYLWKEDGRSNIPIKNEIINEVGSKIFAGEKYRYITYGGGPGLYGMKNATPIAIYREEPSDVAPLHYWIWFGKWIPYQKIKTDIKGYYSAAYTEYGKGKVIIFGPHPEIPPRFNGSVKEYFGLTIYRIPRYVYAWLGGNMSNWSYNWWIIRRSVAYSCNIPLPPPSGLYVSLHELNNGSIEVNAENSDRVAIYVDGSLYEEVEKNHFVIKIDRSEEHTVRAIAYKDNAEAWDEIVV